MQPHRGSQIGMAGGKRLKDWRGEPVLQQAPTVRGDGPWHGTEWDWGESTTSVVLGKQHDSHEQAIGQRNMSDS